MFPAALTVYRMLCHYIDRGQKPTIVHRMGTIGVAAFTATTGNKQL